VDFVVSMGGRGRRVLVNMVDVIDCRQMEDFVVITVGSVLADMMAVIWRILW
jgi:hypothetical protein